MILKILRIFLLILVAVECAAGSLEATAAIQVNNVEQLYKAIEQANMNGGHATILLADGFYPIRSTLTLKVPHIALIGKSKNPEKVILHGDAMSATSQLGNIIVIENKDITIANLTLERCRWHLVQIRGEADADRVHIKNCIFRDSYQQMLKATVNSDHLNVSADDAIIEKNLFEYSAGIGPQYYIGGIDAHASKNWIVRNNVFKYIISPSRSVAEFAIHFWNNSADNLIEDNTIINCDRGIGFGMQGKGNRGGIIRRNYIYHSENAGKFADVGIALAESPKSKIIANTIIQKHSFPWAIEYRFPTTKHVEIIDNMVNRSIIKRDGAQAMVKNNHKL